jgi:hypothetical protein
MTNENLLSKDENSLNSWKEDVKNLIKMIPKIENKILKQIDDIKISENEKHSMFKIDIESKNKKYSIIIMVKE